MILLIFIPGVCIAVVVLIGYLVSAPAYKGKVTDHFDGRKFRNPGNVQLKGFLDLIPWLFNRKPGKWEEVTIVERLIPSAGFNQGDTSRVTFINHSTFLIQTHGMNILTDPIWSKRAGPVKFIGPRRRRPPAIKLEDLPKIDIILLSHNHYDHLDIDTLKQLFRIHKPRIITTLGISKYLEKQGISDSIDLDWWQEKKLNDRISIACVPAQHFSGRGMFDREKSLWCGFVLIISGGSIYFAGDTGLGSFFSEIGQKYNPLKLSILPIGAYIPQWFMQPIHTSPEEAVKIHLECKTARSIASHFGTFPLADDGLFQPVEDLEIAKKKLAIPLDSFIVLPEGKSMDF
jgi:L-ascorbate metabolism protein UlaG (beta-lactamase superfamily)